MSELAIRPATEEDAEAIWQLHLAVVADGQAFMHDGQVSREAVMEKWYGKQTLTYVACYGTEVVGAYAIRPNQPGRGGHVANGTYMVSQAHRGRQIGRRLGEHSLQTACESGYLAIQYNAVVSTNTAAVQLWRSLGFVIIGTVPQGFRHDEFGMVDVYIMYRSLVN